MGLLLKYGIDGLFTWIVSCPIWPITYKARLGWFASITLIRRTFALFGVATIEFFMVMLLMLGILVC